MIMDTFCWSSGKKSQTDEEVVKKSPNTSSTWKPHRDDLDLHMDREKTRLETREENRNSFTFQDKKTTPMGQESAVDNFYNNRGGEYPNESQCRQFIMFCCRAQHKLATFPVPHFGSSPDHLDNSTFGCSARD